LGDYEIAESVIGGRDSVARDESVSFAGRKPLSGGLFRPGLPVSSFAPMRKWMILRDGGSFYPVDAPAPLPIAERPPGTETIAAGENDHARIETSPAHRFRNRSGSVHTWSRRNRSTRLQAHSLHQHIGRGGSASTRTGWPKSDCNWCGDLQCMQLLIRFSISPQLTIDFLIDHMRRLLHVGNDERGLSLGFAFRTHTLP